MTSSTSSWQVKAVADTARLPSEAIPAASVLAPAASALADGKGSPDHESAPARRRVCRVLSNVTARTRDARRGGIGGGRRGGAARVRYPDAAPARRAQSAGHANGTRGRRGSIAGRGVAGPAGDESSQASRRLRPRAGGVAGAAGPAEEQRLLEALRRGEEPAFVALVERYHGRLLRLALLYVPNRAVAEEVVQDTWQGVLVGLARFEGRASLRSWIYRILLNVAKSRGPARAPRRALLGAAGDDGVGEDGEPAVAPDRFRAADPGRRALELAAGQLGRRAGGTAPGAETRAEVQRAIEALPPTQRAVITLRDVEQCPSEEVCALLELSEGNQRVLLHRARSKVRPRPRSVPRPGDDVATPPTPPSRRPARGAAPRKPEACCRVRSSGTASLRRLSGPGTRPAGAASSRPAPARPADRPVSPTTRIVWRIWLR